MQITSFVFTKLSSERTADELDKEPKANTDVKITKVSHLEQGSLKVSFTFAINYSNLGNTILEGSIIISDDSQKIENILESWKNNELNSEVSTKVMNAILYHCNIKALELSREVNLPSHISLSLIKLDSS